MRETTGFTECNKNMSESSRAYLYFVLWIQRDFVKFRYCVAFNYHLSEPKPPSTWVRPQYKNMELKLNTDIIIGLEIVAGKLSISTSRQKNVIAFGYLIILVPQVLSTDFKLPYQPPTYLH